MIYIIDDKKSRQKDYGWGEEKFSSFSQLLMPIWEAEALNNSQEKIIQDGNIILFHESFPQSDDFKRKLEESSSSLNIAYFSGSKGARFVDNNRSMLPPDVLYNNLELFINKCKEDNLNFKYLAFGENYAFEEQLRTRIIEVTNQNTGAEKISCDKNLFFAATSDDEIEVEPPLEIKPTKNWDLDFFGKDVSDIDLDVLVNKWFLQEKYDTIYIPLCFGSVLSDFMGLRLAMHIRFTPSVNTTTPIYIYGEVEFDELKSHYCFDILKTSSVKLIKCDNASFINAYQSENLPCNLEEDLKLIHLELPSNIGYHSLANQWGAEVLARVTGLKYEPDDSIKIARKSLFFKYILTKSKQDDSQIETIEIIDAKRRNILLIDDEADKGWAIVLSNICRGAYFELSQKHVNDFNDLDEDIRNKIKTDFYDLIFLDLRLNGLEEEFIRKPENFSGAKILKTIKNDINRGTQVIILTASNKAWNMKSLLDSGADGYYIKESPEYAFPQTYSEKNAETLIDEIKLCLDRGYLKTLHRNTEKLEKILSYSTFSESTNNRIAKQLKSSYLLLGNARTSNEFAHSFISLEAVFEIISEELLEKKNKKEYEIIDSTEICKNWDVRNKMYYESECIDTNANSLNDYPTWKQICSIYYQLLKGKDRFFGSRVFHLIEARNAFIHNDKEKQNKMIWVNREKTAFYKNIYNQDGYLRLFDIIYKLIELIANTLS